jgi:hypothetical protein
LGLTKLSYAKSEALIVALLAQLAAADERVAAQDARIATQEARLDELTRPPKTPDNSSKRPLWHQKSDRPAAGDRALRNSAADPLTLIGKVGGGDAGDVVLVEQRERAAIQQRLDRRKEGSPD